MKHPNRTGKGQRKTGLNHSLLPMAYGCPRRSGFPLPSRKYRLANNGGFDTSRAFSWGIQVKDLGHDFRTYAFREI